MFCKCIMPHYKKIYIYRDSHLPEEGWIQSCFNCYTYTSSTIDYKVIKYKQVIYECNIYLCPACDKFLHSDDIARNKFRYKCDKYIKYNLFPS